MCCWAFPFTVAALAVGRPIYAINVLGLVLLLVFTHVVRLAHSQRKMPVIAVIVLEIMLLKHRLQGLLTLFSMVGVFASYEARHSLWTMSRQIAVVMLTLTPMTIACA